MKKLLMLAFALVLVSTMAVADTTYNVAWSGAQFGNSASVSGTVTIDTALLNNPGFNSGVGTWLTGVNITVSGATAGNGTFGLSDFYDARFNTNGGTLDLNSSLLGQATNGGPWGTCDLEACGDFNLFSFDGAPLGTWWFTMTTNSGSFGGDKVILTNFSPVPEPGTMALLGTGLFGLALRRRRV